MNSWCWIHNHVYNPQIQGSHTIRAVQTRLTSIPPVIAFLSLYGLHSQSHCHRCMFRVSTKGLVTEIRSPIRFTPVRLLTLYVAPVISTDPLLPRPIHLFCKPTASKMTMVCNYATASFRAFCLIQLPIRYIFTYHFYSHIIPLLLFIYILSQIHY